MFLSNSSSSAQPAPLCSDDCSDPATWTYTNTSLPPQIGTGQIIQIYNLSVTNLPASLQTFNSITASNGFMIINSDAAPGNVDQNGTPIVCEFTNVQPIDLTGYSNVQLTFQHSFLDGGMTQEE